MKIERELMRGAGPTAVLQLLRQREMYGYELVEALSRESDGVLAMGQSTLYPLLYNLEAKGFVASRVDQSGPRPRKYYRLTPKGKKRRSHETKQWLALVRAMTSLGILDPVDVVGTPQTKGAPA
jgi:PadR family transcriptional regulator PadR